MDSPIRILLVDDDPDYVESMVRLLPLQEPAFCVLGAHSVKTAIEAMRAGQVDAVLLDLGLPDSQGIETVYAMVPHAVGVPIIVLSSSVTPEVRHEAVLAGAQDAILKTSVSPEALVRVLLTGMDRVRASLLAPSPPLVQRIEQCMARLRQARAAAEESIRRTDKILRRSVKGGG